MQLVRSDKECHPVYRKMIFWGDIYKLVSLPLAKKKCTTVRPRTLTINVWWLISLPNMTDRGLLYCIYLQETSNCIP